MIVSEKMREWFYSTHKRDGSDAEVSRAVLRATRSGELPVEEFIELLDVPDTEAVKADVAEAFKAALAEAESGFDPDAVAAMVGKRADDFIENQQTNSKRDAMNTGTSPAFANRAMMSRAPGGGDTTRIRVKDVAESFSTKRATGLHCRTGLPVCPDIFGGRPAETPSEWDRARAGVFLKYTARKAGMNVGWGELESRVMDHIVNEDPWCGLVGNEWRSGVRGAELKAILDDSTSGGTYLNPEAFDAAVITYPLLSGELFPNVTIMDVPRGSSIEGATIGNPTVTWNNAEGSALTAFATTALIGHTATTIFPVAVHVEVGRDVLSDSIVSLGTILIDLIGQRMKSDLDYVIATGDGTSQPTGIFNSSGTIAVNAANGSAGPFAVGDFEALSMGVGKQYLDPAGNPAFVMNMDSYRRARSIPVGSDDARRIFGMDHSKFQLLEWTAKIQNNISDGYVAFLPLRKYRLYRRQGLEIRWTDQGDTLTRKNTALLTVRGRWGGFLTDGNSCAKMTDGAMTG